MKHTIYSTNDQNKIELTTALRNIVKKAINATLDYQEIDFPVEISLTFVDNEKIHELNKEYRGKDAPTDVLSFPLDEEDYAGRYIPLGDVIVCPSVIDRQSAEFGTTYRQEFCLMVIHSVLHLLGWDHMEENEKKEMFEKQEKILRALQEGEVKTEE